VCTFCGIVRASCTVNSVIFTLAPVRSCETLCDHSNYSSLMGAVAINLVSYFFEKFLNVFCLLSLGPSSSSDATGPHRRFLRMAKARRNRGCISCTHARYDI